MPQAWRAFASFACKPSLSTELLGITEIDMAKKEFERIEIYKAQEGRFVVRDAYGKTYSFMDFEELTSWLKSIEKHI